MDNQSGLGVRVVKVGGSLLNDVDRWPDLQRWLWHGSGNVHQVLITGGGPWADAVRTLSKKGHVSQETAHWLAIRSMSLTAWVAAQLESSWHHTDRWNDLIHRLAVSDRPQVWVFDPYHWLREEEQQKVVGRLPIGWQVTSDSISAHLAKRLEAVELCLLKSTSTDSLDRSCWERDGVVDPYFRLAAEDLPVTLVNYRQAVSWIVATKETTTTNDLPDEDGRSGRSPPSR